MVVVGFLLAVLWTAADFIALVVFYRWAGFYAAAGLILGTAVLGVLLFRWQMRGVWRRLQQQLTQAALPGTEAADGMLLFLAACLLVAPFPGMDAVGLLLMFAPLRRFLARRIRNWASKRFEPGPGSFVFQMGGIPTHGWPMPPYGPGPGGGMHGGASRADAGMNSASVGESAEFAQEDRASQHSLPEEEIEDAQVRPAEPAEKGMRT
ncbi:MAG: FxsA family protein [Planctomycetota bacterium]